MVSDIFKGTAYWDMIESMKGKEYQLKQTNNIYEVVGIGFSSDIQDRKRLVLRNVKTDKKEFHPLEDLIFMVPIK